jgi:hypothetical protein
VTQFCSPRLRLVGVSGPMRPHVTSRRQAAGEAVTGSARRSEDGAARAIAVVGACRRESRDHGRDEDVAGMMRWLQRVPNVAHRCAR